MRLWLLGMLGVCAIAACSSGGDAQSNCKDYCAKASKACGMTFDLMACNASCASLDGGTPQPMVPAACKPKADTYQSCTRSAQVTCPDGMNPQVTGCDKQQTELAACIQGGGADGGGGLDSGGGFDSGTTCAPAGESCFANTDCCSKSCDMDLYTCN